MFANEIYLERELAGPGGNTGANRKSIFHRCHPILVAIIWELTKETIDLPLGCLQGGGDLERELAGLLEDGVEGLRAERPAPRRDRAERALVRG